MWLANFKCVRDLDREWKARTFWLRRSMTSSESYIFLAVFAALALAALIYLLSPMSLLEDITTRGAEIRTRLREFLTRHDYTADTGTVLVIGAVDQALEHHEAIWLLDSRKLNGSAMAMIRLVYDAMFRALWLNACAKAEQIEQAAEDELNWLRIPVRDDIKRAYFGGVVEDPAKAAELDKVFGKEMENLVQLHAFRFATADTPLHLQSGTAALHGSRARPSIQQGHGHAHVLFRAFAEKPRRSRGSR